MSSPCASTLRTMKASLPRYCACTIAGGPALAGRATVAGPAPSTAVTVPTDAPPAFVTGVLVIFGGTRMVVVGRGDVVVVRGGAVGVDGSPSECPDPEQAAATSTSTATAAIRLLRSPR